MKIFPALAVLSLSLVPCRPSARAGDYQGADAILKQAEAPPDGSGDASQKPNPVHLWREDIKNYQKRAATLTPDEAAHDWLALFDRALKLPASPLEGNYGGRVTSHVVEVFQALPPPADWDALAAQVATRPLPEKGSSDFVTPVLRIITRTLQNKPGAVRPSIDALKQQADDLDGSRQNQYQQLAANLQDAFLIGSGDKKGALASFEAKLAILQPSEGSSSSTGQREMLRTNSLEVPDLIALAGAPRAEALLKQVFTLDIRGVTIRDEKTSALARKVALEMGDQLKFAPWSLVDTLDAVPLYEGLDKRFHGSADEQSDRATADAYYLLGLITLKRSDDATAQAVKMGNASGREQEDALGALPEEALGDLAAKGYATEVYQFFDRLLAGHPELPYWHSFTVAGVLAGQTDAMLASVKAASERADLKPRAKSELRHAYGEALLAADHVAEALPILRAGAVIPKQVGIENGSGRNDVQQAMQAAATLAAVGQLVGDDALVNEQLDAIATAAKAQPGILDNVTGPWEQNLNELFLAANRGPEMERLLTASLQQGEKMVTANLTQWMARLSMPNEAYYFQSTRTPLLALIDLYFRVGRYPDVVALLDHAKQWGAEDVAGLVNPRSGGASGSFGYQAARALQKTGNTDAALRLVNAYLENNGGSDPAYALLLELLPPDKAEARLNELFQGDQFEERPLIWRAVLQLGQGRLDEAEKSARQAIGIDPSDGEEGRGDRMRAYAVLGDILDRKGDTEKAAQMRQAVQAIRLSEDADRFHAAGLLTRAVGMYEKALGYFSNAYCIQSRLAIQLTALGKTDEAMTHYERAYELMPESFGRLESHCFGCERAFAGKRAQTTAERVFQKFVDEQPSNPRVHYLLGYLRNEQDRTLEAAREFREAVKLDPDYINAWKQLASTTDDPADRDRAALNLVRLDPRHKHDSADFTTVGDLRALWTAVEAAAKFAPPEPASLYPLAASKAFMEQERRSHPQKPAGDEATAGLAELLDQDGERFTPPSVILKNKVITQALQFLPRNESDESL